MFPEIMSVVIGISLVVINVVKRFGVIGVSLCFCRSTMTWK